MAQSNYTLANKSAPASRAKVNDVFQSIATNNSGDAPPSTTFPHQWWYDTTTNILKQRNAADSAWIDIGSFDQGDGTFFASVAQLSQNQVEDDTSTVFGSVSGKRLAQQTNAAFNVSGSAPLFACRAWVNFNGTLTSGNIRSSGNVSSVTRNGTGLYTVNFTTSMPDADYSAQTDHDQQTTSGHAQAFSYTTTSISLRTVSGGNLSNAPTISVAIFR